MHLFTVSSLLTGVFSFTMAILVYLKGKKIKVNQLWAIFALAVAIWGFGGLKFSTVGDKEAAYFWLQLTYVGIIFIPVLFLHFTYTFLEIENKRFVLNAAYLLTFVYLFFNFFEKNLFLGEPGIIFNSFYWITNGGPVFFFFMFVHFFGLVVYCHFELFKRLKKTSGTKQIQIKYFILATAIGFTGGGLSFLPCLGIKVYPISNFAVPLYPLIMAYAMLRYSLMDIKVAVTRSGIFILVYTIVLGMPFALTVLFKQWLIEALGPNWWIASLGLMAALATVGPFIYIYLDRRAEEALLREQRRYQETLKQASVGMTRIRNLRKLLDLITHIVTKTVKINYAAIYLFDAHTEQYVLQVSRDKGRIPVPTLSPDNPLIKWIMVKREPLIYEEIKRLMQELENPTYKLLEENMRLLTAMVVIPSFLEDRFIGFIILGDKASGQMYTPDDLNVFQVLASQAALAIENAQFYEEAKEMQEQIAQAEKMATVGTMADGLSHQINNRFYALSLIAGDTIDTIKHTDTSRCTPEVKEMIGSISHALERIQSNVIQGGEVVKGILKYTRKDEGSFESIDLDQIINGTLEMVQYKVKLSEIDLVRDYVKDTSKVKGNLVQLEEAFFNFIDNAYDAIVERRTTLKEEGYKGRITISARPKDSKLEIIVQDNGMGIKDADNKKIFTPFFTTKTSSRKGTGLGLYVIKRIITDTHHGTINFESANKFGTRFILTLPLAD